MARAATNVGLRGRSGCGSNQVVDDVDVAVNLLRVGADLRRLLDQGPGDVAVKTGKADVETGTERVLGAGHMQVCFGIDRKLRDRDFALLGNDPDRALEAGRPASCEELFRIGAFARRAGRRKLDVEAAIVAAR